MYIYIYIYIYVCRTLAKREAAEMAVAEGLRRALDQHPHGAHHHLGLVYEVLRKPEDDDGEMVRHAPEAVGNRDVKCLLETVDVLMGVLQGNSDDVRAAIVHAHQVQSSWERRRDVPVKRGVSFCNGHVERLHRDALEEVDPVDGEEGDVVKW